MNPCEREPHCACCGFCLHGWADLDDEPIQPWEAALIHECAEQLADVLPFRGPR